MKKIIVILLFTAFYGVSQAQISLPKIDTKSTGAAVAINDFVTPPAIGDIGGTAGNVVEMLSSKLSLQGTQKPKLMEAVSSFLTDKKSIAGLADTNPADYLAKFNPLQKGLFGKLKGIMGATAFTKMLGLKPKGDNIAGNALSHLFF